MFASCDGNSKGVGFLSFNSKGHLHSAGSKAVGAMNITYSTAFKNKALNWDRATAAQSQKV